MQVTASTFRRYLPVVRGVVITLAAGALAYYLAALTASDDHRWPATMAVLVGGITLVVQVLLHLGSRVDSLLRQDQSASAGVVGNAEPSHMFYDALTDLAYKAGRIGSHTPPLLVALGREELRAASTLLDEFGRQADATYEGEDRHWLLHLTRHAGRSIQATSMTTVDAGGRGFADGGLWLSQLGQRYLGAQREAVMRGVSIRRVFIMDRPELLDDESFKEIWGQHIEYGIQARVIDPSELPGGPESAADFILFDKEISYETTSAYDPPPSCHPAIVRTSLISETHRVAERAQYFEKVWAAATW